VAERVGREGDRALIMEFCFILAPFLLMMIVALFADDEGDED
jgi:hypothetical protein